MPRSAYVGMVTLCLDSKIGGGKMTCRFPTIVSPLCLDSKIGGGKMQTFQMSTGG